MPDFPTSLPPAGWYTDPSNPAAERWWGGVDWTESTRALQPAMMAPPVMQSVPVQQPAFAGGVPGGGVNPFAAVPGGGVNPFAAEEAAAVQPSALSTWDPAAHDRTDSFAALAGFSGGSAPSQSGAWYEQSRGRELMPAPTNTAATIGLVLSLLQVLLIGFIVSITALHKARQFEALGQEPIGRTRARWGVALAVVFFLAQMFAGIVWVPIFLAEQQAALLALQASNAPPVDGFPDEPPATVSGLKYDKLQFEQAVVQTLAASAEPTADMVSCPADQSILKGSSITCQYAIDGANHVMTFMIIDDFGGYQTSIDGGPVQ